jgi:hypothetical protein
MHARALTCTRIIIALLLDGELQGVPYRRPYAVRGGHVRPIAESAAPIK